MKRERGWASWSCIHCGARGETMSGYKAAVAASNRHMASCPVYQRRQLIREAVERDLVPAVVNLVDRIVAIVEERNRGH